MPFLIYLVELESAVYAYYSIAVAIERTVFTEHDRAGLILRSGDRLVRSSGKVTTAEGSVIDICLRAI